MLCWLLVLVPFWSFYLCTVLIIPHDEPVILNHCVNLKLGHRFHALLKVCFDRDDTVPLIFNVIVHPFIGCQLKLTAMTTTMYVHTVQTYINILKWTKPQARYKFVRRSLNCEIHWVSSLLKFSVSMGRNVHRGWSYMLIMNTVHVLKTTYQFPTCSWCNHWNNTPGRANTASLLGSAIWVNMMKQHLLQALTRHYKMRNPLTQLGLKECSESECVFNCTSDL